MSANWSAIIAGDYEMVMPLTWKRKYGISYLYQPAFIQQGGIYGKKKPDTATVKRFIELAMQHFRFAECTLNYSNAIPAGKDLKHSLWNNYILNIENNYESISGNYDAYIRQRLNRLKKFNHQYIVSHNHQKAITIYKKLYGTRMSGIRGKDYNNFATLCDHYAGKKRTIVREVWDETGKTLLAMALFLKDEKRLYNIASSVTDIGRKKLANYFLYDAVIREFSGKGLVLDFEGSDIPGVAYFYEKWKDGNEPYPFIKWNHLPAPVKWLKK